MSNERGIEKPGSELFLDALIRVIGVLSDFDPSVGVPRLRVLEEVLVDMGIDPDDPPWPLKGEKGKRPGLYRIIGTAFRHLKSEDYGLCSLQGRGKWSLTDRGVKKACRLFEERDRRTEDKRDRPGWVVLELSKLGEQKVEEGNLAVTLRADLGVGENFPVFVPSARFIRGNRTMILHLLEGYVFVGAGLDEIDYFSLEKKSYVCQVMSSVLEHPPIRVLSVVEDSRVDAMKAQLRRLCQDWLREGDRVRILQGDLRSMEGRVILLDGESAHVKIELRSMEICACVPKIFLEISNEWGT